MLQSIFSKPQLRPAGERHDQVQERRHHRPPGEVQVPLPRPRLALEPVQPERPPPEGSVISTSCVKTPISNSYDRSSNRSHTCWSQSYSRSAPAIHSWPRSSDRTRISFYSC